MSFQQNEYALQVEDLWVKYPGREWVIEKLHLKIRKGETVLILGDTGSGKTTFIRALTGVAEKLYGALIKGKLLVNGIDIRNKQLDEILKQIQVVNQNPYTHFTDVILREDLIAYAETMYDEKLAKNIVEKITKTIGINNNLDKPIYQLSGGQAKKAAIAKALISDPAIILLDEPLMWLDDPGSNDLVNTLISLKRLGKTFVILEHRFFALLKLVDKSFILRQGKLVEIDIVSCMKNILETLSPSRIREC